MYENTTYEVILQRMLDRVSNKFDKREGSVIWDTHSPTAIELQILYLELDQILTEAYGDTASREYLILRCAERGITPYEASYTTLLGYFTPEDIGDDALIGQRFNIDDVNFVVTESAADEYGSGYYYVQCETAGTVGNQYLGTMTPIDYISGLETAELVSVLIPGEDEEETESLRERYFSSFEERAFGGNRVDYLSTVNAISGVGGVKVTRIWNGDISPSDMIPSDAVTTWYQSVIGTLGEEIAAWLTAIYTAAVEKKLVTGGTVLITILDSEYNAASSTLVSTVQETLDPEENAGEGYGLAPIGHVVSVKSVEEVEVTVKTTITFESGYSWSNLKSSIEAAIEVYLLSLRQSWADSDYLVVRISQIETHILGVAGVTDVSDTKINGVESNLTLGEYEIPVLGGASE